MIDQCDRCTMKGHLSDCLATECFHHDSWFEQTIITQLTKAEAIIKAYADWAVPNQGVAGPELAQQYFTDKEQPKP